MNQVTEAERLGSLAIEQEQLCNWLQAIDKHTRAASIYFGLSNHTSHLSAKFTAKLLAEHHSTRSRYISELVENKTLRVKAGRVRELSRRAAGFMNKAVYGNLRGAYDGLKELASSLTETLEDIDRNRKNANLLFEPVDLAYAPADSMIHVSQSGAGITKSPSWKSFQCPSTSPTLFLDQPEMKKANDKLKASCLFYCDENQRLRDVLLSFQDNFKDRLFDLKSAIEMANVKASEEIEGRPPQNQLLLENAQLKHQLKMLQDYHTSTTHESNITNQQIRTLSLRLEKETQWRLKLVAEAKELSAVRAKQDKKIQHMEERWEDLKHSAKRKQISKKVSTSRT